jgi:DNA-binding NarL/FixJ family response regulator
MKARTRQSDADTRKKVLIVDDHPLVREGLARVINQQHDLVVCGEAGDARTGLSAVVKTRPDVVIVDISLEEGCGLDLIKDLRTRHPELSSLALSMHHENLYAERAIRAGARGYVMKREPVDAVIAAIRRVLGGQIAVSENIINRVVGGCCPGHVQAPPSVAERLSDRELEVFRLYGQGRNTRQIATALHVAVSTVESYRGAIKRKLALGCGTELVACAARFVANEAGG